MANNQTNEHEKRKEKLEKQIKELESKIQEQEEQINHLQSSGFQLLNFYFVFQGVIFTSVANGGSALTRSCRWMPFTLSLSAACINLVSLVVIGRKYTSILTKRDQSCLDCHRLQTQLSEHDHRPQNSNNEDAAAASPPEQSQMLLDPFSEWIRVFCFQLCMGVCLAVAIIMSVACWTIRREATSKNPSNVNDTCFRLCDAKCMGICNEY
ncbi:hypothetical protein ACE6H2_004710 [Prunus campanulata]